MAKIIFQTENLNLEKNKKNITTNGFISDREILKNRSKKYMDLINSLDTKTLTETKGMEDLMNNIHEEFGTADISNLPLGIVARCFLGHPHEVHTLDLINKQIIQHYKIGEPLPHDFEKARTLAKHNSYAFIEVYRDRMILIKQDGSASKL